MANKFDQYGLKEVANVTFYALEADTEKDIVAGQPVLYLDTLKVSNIETTAEDTSAQGGWGNPKLITWEYGKEANLTLEDALFSPASLEVMMGANLVEAATATPVETQITRKITIDDAGKITKEKGEKIPSLKGLTFNTDGKNQEDVYAITNAGKYEKIEIIRTAGVAGAPNSYKVTINNKFTFEDNETEKIINIFYKVTMAGNDSGTANVIEISADKFGGTYKIVGDTLVRNLNGKDEAFQFVVEKAKINADVTFEMSADGDPATFSMPITAMKAEDGTMFKLIKYAL